MVSREVIQAERDRTRDQALALIARGICPACYDLEHDEPYGRGDRVIFEDDLFLVKLERHPEAVGHTIVTYKPHRDGFSSFSVYEGSDVMAMCVRVAQAPRKPLVPRRCISPR